jgi:5-methylcytosine-specific restriction endonuclease McrA
MMTEVNQRRLVMLFCIRCNGQETLLDEQVAFQLRISSDEWLETKAEFTRRGFLGEDNVILNWDKRQFLSDSSATRVRKHREKRVERGLTAQDWIPKSLRAKVFARDGNACIYCTSPDDLTLDHKTPTSRGGSNEEDNLQVACRACNADKRHMTHDEYMDWQGRVTFLKRPQNTDTEQKQNRNSAAKPPAVSFSLPLWVHTDTWQDFEAHRGKLRKPMTDRARRDIIAKLDGLRAKGQDPEAMLAQSIRKGWQDVFEVRDDLFVAPKANPLAAVRFANGGPR